MGNEAITFKDWDDLKTRGSSILALAESSGHYPYFRCSHCGRRFRSDLNHTYACVFRMERRVLDSLDDIIESYQQKIFALDTEYRELFRRVHVLVCSTVDRKGLSTYLGNIASNCLAKCLRKYGLKSVHLLAIESHISEGFVALKDELTEVLLEKLAEIEKEFRDAIDELRQLCSSVSLADYRIESERVFFRGQAVTFNVLRFGVQDLIHGRIDELGNYVPLEDRLKIVGNKVCGDIVDLDIPFDLREPVRIITTIPAIYSN